MAEQCLKQLLTAKNLSDKFEVASCGIQGSAGVPLPRRRNMTEYPLHWDTTRPILEELGLDTDVFYLHKTTPITEEIMERSYVIFAMDNLVFYHHEASLVKQFPEHRNKIRIFAELFEKKVTFQIVGIMAMPRICIVL